MLEKGSDLDRPEIDFMLSYHFFGLDSLVLRIFLSYFSNFVTIKVIHDSVTG